MKRMISITMIAALLLTFAGCGGPLPALTITGDCEEFNLTRNMPLAEAIELAGPRAAGFDILLIGSDGLVARVSGDEISGCALVYSRENAWELRSELHPPSANVKNLALVAIVGPQDTRALLRLLKEEGTSTKNNRSVTVYTTLVITKTAADALRFLERGERVLVIEPDGLGWEMLQRADAPFLQSLRAERALACYPPISPVGLASMLTGVTPDIHGIRDRENREMACEDIFAKAVKLGKTSAYIESRNALIKTSIAPVLSLNDEEVYENARKNLASDLLFVHFHEIDDTAQQYGPYARQTLQKIREIDGYVQALAQDFDGRVIITADHGLHEAPDGGGYHGDFKSEDMIVPYIIK